MSVIDELRSLSVEAQTLRGRTLSERNTERLLIEPFIGALGYNTRDLDEVETQPSIRVASTELKCDYAIKSDGAPLILIESKKTEVTLGSPEQLGTYFERERGVWLGVYTNGLEYRFYSGSNVDGLKQMDAAPFLTLDLLNFDERVAQQVSAFAKGRFDPDGVRALARNIRDKQDVENALRAELTNPSDGLVTLLMERMGAESGEFGRYKPIVQEVAPQFFPNAQSQRPAASTVAPSSGRPPSIATPSATQSGIPIRWVNRRETYEAVLLEYGRGGVGLDDREFRTPSSACQHILPGRPANGWAEWEYFDLVEQRWLPVAGLRGMDDAEQTRKAGRSMGFVPLPQPRSYRT